MSEFILPIEDYTGFGELDAFTQGYIEALFFTESEPSTDRESHDPKDVEAGIISEIPGDYGFDDLSGDALQAIIADCAKFQSDAKSLLDQAYLRDYDERQAGRDYWFTRNGHGVGFWDRGELGDTGSKVDGGELGDALSEIARAHGEVWAYIGDDSRVYVQ